MLEPKTPFLDNWHIGLLAEHLEALADGSILRLIINVPPRSGKSLLATVLFPTWVWVCNPSERFLFASYSAALSTKHSVDRRVVLTSPFYRQRWSNIRLSDDQNLKTEFSNTARGSMVATSVGGSATGKGGNILVADDILNPAQADSDLERATAVRWFDESYSTRLDDKKGGRIMVIEQRTHAMDLSGHLLAQGGWTHVSLPAEAPSKTIVIFPRSGKQIVREEGDILWPAREGHAELAAAKLRLGSYAYASQYGQNPTGRGGNLFKSEWLARYQMLPGKVDALVLSLDTAFKTGSENDYSAAVVLALLKTAHDGCRPGFYVVDCWHGKAEFSDLKRKVVELHDNWKPQTVLIEDAASGPSLIQELRRGTALPVKPIRVDSDKMSRAASVQPIVEGGRLLLPTLAPWLGDFQNELLGFPGGAHDDMVDALVHGLSYLRGEGEDPNLLIYYQQMKKTEEAYRAARKNDGPRGLTAGELARFKQEAGDCVLCGRNLLQQPSVKDGRGRVCMSCA